MTGTATPAAVTPRNSRTMIKTITSGASNYAIVDVTMSSAYVTGGDTCDFTAIGGVGVVPKAVICGGSAGYVAEYDIANTKMKVYRSAGSAAALAEPNSVDLHTIVFRCVVFF